MEEETLVWEGRPSQITNLGFYFVAVLTCWLVVPVVMALWQWLVVKYTNYRVTTERLTVTTGVLSRRTEELELYRVKDTALDQPFFLRLFGLGNVVLRTSDRSHPLVQLRAIREGRTLREEIRSHVEKLRERKGVRETDYV